MENIQLFAYTGTHLTTSQLPHSYKLVYTPAVPAPTSAESELSQRTNSASAKLYLDIDIYMATKLKIPHNPPSLLKLPTPLCPDLVIVATIDPSPGYAHQYPDGPL